MHLTDNLGEVLRNFKDLRTNAQLSRSCFHGFNLIIRQVHNPTVNKQNIKNENRAGSLALVYQCNQPPHPKHKI